MRALSPRFRRVPPREPKICLQAFKLQRRRRLRRPRELLHPHRGGRRTLAPRSPASPPGIRLDLSDSSSDEGDTTSDEEDIQSGQPEPSRLPVPSKPVKPRATFAQTTLTGGLVANKRAKLTHVSTEDDDEATVIKFSGGNLTKAQLNELVERRFLEQTMEEESGEGSPKKAKKNKKEKGKPKPMFTKAGKPSSAASTEQKGTPLFMNRRLIFSCSCLW